MTKKGFLEKLKTALDSNLSDAAVQEQIAFYKQYIEDEVRKGRSEEEVVKELGDPWAIARTIIDSAEIRGGTGTAQCLRRSGSASKYPCIWD